VVDLISVALTVLDGQTLKRELAPLEKIRNNYAKYIITWTLFPAETTAESSPKTPGFSAGIRALVPA